MASQRLYLVGSWNPQCRRSMCKQSASHKYERVMNSASTCHRNFGHEQHSSRSHVKVDSSSPRLENENRVQGKKTKLAKGGSEVRERPRLGFWYLTSCISHILRKARAYYNELCCDAMFDDGHDTTRSQGYSYEEMSVDPYFSIPVTPVPSHGYSKKYKYFSM